MKPSPSAPRNWPCRNPDPNSVGVKLRRTRLALGMTQKELAAHFGVTRETIYRVEGGKKGDRCMKLRVRILRELMRHWAEMHKPAEANFEDEESLWAEINGLFAK